MLTNRMAQKTSDNKDTLIKAKIDSDMLDCDREIVEETFDREESFKSDIFDSDMLNSDMMDSDLEGRRKVEVEYNNLNLSKSCPIDRAFDALATAVFENAGIIK